jgi:hypothetical protein
MRKAMKYFLTVFAATILVVLAVTVAGCGAKEDPIDPGPIAQPGDGANAPDGMSDLGGGAEASGSPPVSTGP